MSVEQISSRTDQITSIIQRAAQNNQQDFNYMLAQARIESGLNPEAKAKTSSAAGLYQFTSGTWMDLVKRHGDKVGLHESALSLRNGNISSSDKSDLLAKRHDPALSSELAARFAIENAQTLQRSGHEKVGATELYIAHFLGPQGANTFLTGLKTKPDAPAAPALPQAASANAQVFYSAGKARSYADIFSQFQKKFGGDASAEQVAAVGVAPKLQVKSAAAAIAKAAQAVDTPKPRAPGQPLPVQPNVSPEDKTEKMSAPAIDKAKTETLSEAAVQGVAAKALQQAAQETSAQQSDLNLDEASLGSFLRGFTFHQADPGLTPVINDAETRDASRGVGSDEAGDFSFGPGRQLSGHAIGGRLIVKTADHNENAQEVKAEEARRPAPPSNGKAGFSDWAALWGGASKAGAQRTS